MRITVDIDSKLPMVCARSGTEADVVVVHELIDSPTLVVVGIRAGSGRRDRGTARNL